MLIQAIKMIHLNLQTEPVPDLVKVSWNDLHNRG
jgi:hypothetical protein